MMRRYAILFLLLLLPIVACGQSSHQGDVTISADATDAGSGVAAIRLLVDGQVLETCTEATPAPSSSCSTVWDSTAAADGSHLIRAEADDAAGNSSSAEVTIVSDNVGPSIMILVQ